MKFQLNLLWGRTVTGGLWYDPPMILGATTLLFGDREFKPSWFLSELEILLIFILLVELFDRLVP